jgi:ABC-type molybdenum transport system ATPase subunit/photorepair protein PhrA
MSEYRAQTTKFKDKDCLVEALMAAGYKREVIETHDVPQQLFDFQGRATHYVDKTGDKANVIIRRSNIGYGAANDLGFRWNEKTKTYEAMVSAYDSSAAHWGAEGDRMKKTEQAYAELVIAKTMKKNGFKYLGTKTVNGKKQVQYLDLKA